MLRQDHSTQEICDRIREGEQRMMNPLSTVKNTREVWSKFLEKNVREVQVQFKDEPPAWIPYETLLAIEETRK